MHLERCGTSNTLLRVDVYQKTPTHFTCESLKSLILHEKRSLQKEIAEAEMVVWEDNRRYRLHQGHSLILELTNEETVETRKGS